MAKKRKILKRKPTLYQQVSKRFTALNKKLPENKKLSIQQRRRILKETIMPALYATPKYKIRWREVSKRLNAEVNRRPARTQYECNLNYISPSQYAYVEWFEIDDFLTRILPDCIYVKVNAGRFGVTKIFNTRNYSYTGTGVQKITEKIRPYVNNNSGFAWYTGYQKLRPRMKNDGKAESYYLELILYVDIRGNSAAAANPGKESRFEFTNKKSKKAARTKTDKISDKLNARFKKLQAEKDRKRRAYREIGKDKKKISGVVNKKPTSRNFFWRVEQFAKNYERATKKLDRYLEKGLITKYRYDKSKQELLAQWKKFNEE